MVQNNNLAGLSGIIAKKANLNKALSRIYNSALPNPNKIIKDNGNKVSPLAEILEDPHVSSCVQSRKSGVVSMKWKIELQEGGDEAQLTEIKSVFNSLKIDRITKEILNAPLFGYQPLEIIWQILENKYVPVDIIGKPQDWFDFDEYGRLRYIPQDLATSEKVIVPKMKFFDVRYEANYTNPYGEPILAKCYYPALFKKDSTRLWAVFLEKYGMPYLVATVEDNLEEKDRNEILDALDALKEDGLVVIDEGKVISLLDSAGKSSPDMFKEFIDCHNAEISKAILSQTLTTEQGGTGSYAMSQTHLQVRQDIVDGDAALVEEQFNNLIKWYLEINYGTISEPPIFSFYKEAQINKEEFDVIIALCGTGQFKMKKELLTRRGFQEDEFEIIEPASTAPTFAENDNNVDTISSADAISGADSGVKNLSKAIDDNIINHIKHILTNATSFETAYDEIIKAYGTLDATELEKAIVDGIALSKLGGLLSAKV